MDIGCYIIFSGKLNRFYIGACQSCLQERIVKHNSAFYGTCYTSSANDWIIFLFIPTQDFSHAIRLERKIKSMKSSTFIKNLQKYPELLQKIINETK